MTQKENYLANMLLVLILGLPTISCHKTMSTTVDTRQVISNNAIWSVAKKKIALLNKYWLQIYNNVVTLKQTYPQKTKPRKRVFIRPADSPAPYGKNLIHLKGYPFLVVTCNLGHCIASFTVLPTIIKSDIYLIMFVRAKRELNINH